MSTHFSKVAEKANSESEWLGRLPSGWQVLRLKRVCRVFPSNVDKLSIEGETPVRLCNYTDVYYNDQITPDLDFMAATATPGEIEKFTLRAGDVIFTKDSETADDIAIAARVDQDMPGVLCGYHLSIARPYAHTDGRFIKWFFDSNYARACFEVRANGLTRVGLTQHAVDNVELPVPPLEDQRIIAAFLDRETARIDRLAERLERLIGLMEEKRQAVISHAVTKGLDPDALMKDSGVDWLGQVPAHWEVLTLRHCLTAIGQGWSPECEDREKTAGEWGVLKTGCVNYGSYNPQQHKTLPATLDPRPHLEVRPGDVLMSRASGSLDLIGSVALVEETPEQMMFSDKTYRLGMSRRIRDARFLVSALGAGFSREQIRLAVSGAEGLANNISKESVRGIWLAVPPGDEQVKIADAISAENRAVSEAKAHLNATMERLKERRSALSTAAVTGQIPLSEMVASAEDPA